MKWLMILANGFEDVEAIATIDVLKRAHVNLTVATLHNKDTVITSHNNQLVVDTHLKDINYVDYDFLIIPGGQAVFKELDGNKLVDEIVNDFCSKKKLVSAICAAPTILGLMGYLRDKKFTCWS